MGLHHLETALGGRSIQPTANLPSLHFTVYNQNFPTGMSRRSAFAGIRHFLQWCSARRLLMLLIATFIKLMCHQKKIKKKHGRRRGARQEGDKWELITIWANIIKMHSIHICKCHNGTCSV